jgi:rod shape-determining protein MreC
MATGREDFVIAFRSTFLKEKNKRKFSLIILIFTSIIFLIFSNYNFKIIDYTKSGINEIIYRLAKIVSSPEKKINSYLGNFNNLLSVYKKNIDLKSKIEKFESKNISLEILKFENKKLKKQLDDYIVSDKLIHSKVIIDKKSPYLRSFVINKGSKDGIVIGMTVFDQSYLAGKVIETNYSTSRVLLLSDINSNIPVTISPNNIQAIVTGNGLANGRINFLKKNLYKKINTDSIVYTSGTAGLIKSGIPVGKVWNFDPNTDKEIKVNFFSDFSQLQYVSIVSFKKDETKIAIDQNISENDLTTSIQLNKKIETIIGKNEINEEVRLQTEIENEKLKKILENLTNENFRIKKEIIRQNETIKNQSTIISESKIDWDEYKFLELNLLYGKKCSKANIRNIFKKSFKVGSPEYRNCVLNKGKLQ